MSGLMIDCLLPANVTIDDKEFEGCDGTDVVFLEVSDSSEASDSNGTFFAWKLSDGHIKGRSIEFDLSREQVVELAAFLQFSLGRTDRPRPLIK